MPMRATVMIALALQRKSATSISCLRQSSGSGAAIMLARSTPNSAITLSTLDRHHTVGRQAERVQPRGKRRDRAVCFCVRKPTRPTAGDRCAVWAERREPAPRAAAR